MEIRNELRYLLSVGLVRALATVRVGIGRDAKSA